MLPLEMRGGSHCSSTTLGRMSVAVMLRGEEGAGEGRVGGERGWGWGRRMAEGVGGIMSSVMLHMPLPVNTHIPYTIE